MESSRIFVKGLPPNLSPDDFRKHFSKQSAITDAKLIPHRRIGYVGFKTSEDATRAVKYHNKSFIRMSKIAVELARSVEDQYDLRLKIHSSNSSKSEGADAHEHGSMVVKDDERRKRMLEGSAESEGKPKLQEYLQVMQPPSKSNIWENQDVKMSQGSAQPTPGAENARTRAAQSGDDYEHVLKKRKKEGPSEEKNRAPAVPPVLGGIPSVDAETVPSERNLSQEATQEPLTESLAVSDADWLRSRTSRLLGLVDDGDMQVPALPEDTPTEEICFSEVPELVKDCSISDANIHTDEALEVESAIAEDGTVDNGRLFVRNLTYTSTEEDLRKHFEDRGHGLIEEVSSRLYNYDFCLITFS